MIARAPNWFRANAHFEGKATANPMFFDMKVCCVVLHSTLDEIKPEISEAG